MRNFILLLILFAAGLESASAQRTGLFRKRRAYNAPAFNVTRFSEKTPQTASAKDSTAADSIRRQAVAQQRPAKDSAAIAGNKADAPSKAKPASTVDSVGRSSSRSRQSRDLQSGQFFAENDQNDSTIVILRNGQVQEVRIRDGNVIIRNETAEPPLNVGKPVPLPRPISAPIYEPDTLNEVNLAERDSAATQTEAAPGIRKISPKSQIPQPAGTAPAKAKRPVAKPSPARPAPRQAPRRDSLRGNTEADTSARQPMATDSTDIRLGQNLDALQARLSEMEKRLSAQQDSARPDAGNRRAKRLEEDSVYVSNTRRSEALQRRLDSLDNQRQLDSDTRQPFRERVAGWWQRNFGGKKNRKTAEVDTSAARPPGSNVRPDASGRRGNNEDARQQTYARRDSLQRELARLNN
ncbi:MAG: hypothetical protein MUD08_15805, partial [Cytophagales bacterium]|nr:hypothetical protein [Cytophagales bacterium]